MTKLSTVVCVYKSGGSVYTKEYVKRLQESCLKHGAKEFICFTDDKTVNSFCDTLVLNRNYPGWWSKMELFRLTFGKYVYFDLDTIIHNDITPLLKYDHKFSMLKDFNKKVIRPASGVMAWSGDHSYLLNEFSLTIVDEYTPSRGGKLGDQAYIEDHIKTNVEYIQDLFPAMVTSFKWDTQEAKENSSIVCYHGNPRPHETGWKL